MSGATEKRKMKPLITVQILNWNRRDDLREAIESALVQTYPKTETLVVDNHSTDGSVDAVKKLFPDVRVVCLDRNYGCPGGRNRGVLHSRGEFVFFLDNDGVLARDAVQRAYEAIEARPETAVVTARTMYYFTGEERRLFDKRSPHVGGSYVSTFSGGASLHRKEVFVRAGGYPDDFVYGGEETDLALRMIALGYDIWFEPSSVMLHKMTPEGRDRRAEWVSSHVNALQTAVRLLPIEMAVLFAVKSLSVDMFRLWRSGALSLWLKESPESARRVARAILRNRRAVSRSTMAKVALLRESSPLRREELVVRKSDYWRMLFRTVTRSAAATVSSPKRLAR